MAMATPMATQEKLILGRRERAVTDVVSLRRTHADNGVRAIGVAVQEARAKLGLSQQALASLMRDRGHDWFQTTVSKIELGDRSLLWAEGKTLQAIIGFDSTDVDKESVAKDLLAYRRILAIIDKRRTDD